MNFDLFTWKFRVILFSSNSLLIRNSLLVDNIKSYLNLISLKVSFDAKDELFEGIQKLM